MQRLVLCGIFAMTLAGCKTDVTDDDDEFGSWTNGGAQGLPGGATDLPDGDDTNDDDDPDGDLGGLGDGSGGGSTDAYAGGYPINPCASIPTATGVGVGDVSPDWTLQDQYGETVRLSDFCGSVVLLESAAFW